MKSLACYQWTGDQIIGPVVRLIMGSLDQEQRSHYLTEMNKDLNARANLFKPWHQRQDAPVH